MRRGFVRSVALCCGLIVSINQAVLPLAHAATNTWNGNSATTSDWTDSTNWTGGVPTNDSTADVIFGGTNRLDSTVDTNNPWSIKSITFNNTAGAFEIQLNALQIDSGGITNNSTETETFDNDITVGASQSWNAASGDLVFNGSITTNVSLTVTGANDTTFTGAFNGNGGLIKDGAGNADDVG